MRNEIRYVFQIFPPAGESEGGFVSGTTDVAPNGFRKSIFFVRKNHFLNFQESKAIEC